MRSLAAALLLCHYLLVGVLGGAWASWERRASAPSAARPYVHSGLCQAHNYLRLDCFDNCNGDQPGTIIKKIVGADDGTGAPTGVKEKQQFDDHLLLVAWSFSPRAGHSLVTTPSALGETPPLTLGADGTEGPPPKIGA